MNNNLKVVLIPVIVILSLLLSVYSSRGKSQNKDTSPTQTSTADSPWVVESKKTPENATPTPTENKSTQDKKTQNNVTLQPKNVSTPRVSQAAKPIQSPNPTTSTGTNLTLKDLNGNAVTLSQFRGKKVFINFWETWCDYCIKEMPDIQTIQKENDPDIIILAVNVGEAQDTVSSFINKNNYTFRVLLDGEKKLAQQFKVSGYPTSIFIDRDGKTSSQAIGLITLDEMKNRLNAIP